MQWMQTIAQHLKSGGKQVNQQNAPSFRQCPVAPYAHQVDAVHFDTYSNAFGSSSSPRHWLAIDEVTARVQRQPADGVPGSDWLAGTPASGARRILATVEAAQAQDELLAAQIASRPLSWETVPETVSVADVIAVQGNVKTSDASEVGRNQPFFGDLTMMPDPAKEPLFECTEYTLNTTDKLKCGEAAGTAFLRSTHDTPGRQRAAKASRNLQSYLHFHRQELLQRNTAKENYFRSASRRLQGSGGIQAPMSGLNLIPGMPKFRVDFAHTGTEHSNSIKEWVMDFVKDYIIDFEESCAWRFNVANSAKRKITATRQR